MASDEENNPFLISDHVVPPPSERFMTDHLPSVQVKYFSNEKSFKERLQLYFVKNRQSSLRIRLFNVFIKILTCVLYVTRVIQNMEQNKSFDEDSQFFEEVNSTKQLIEAKTQEEYLVNPVVNYGMLIWVERSFWLWLIQVIAASISISETVLVMYISYKGNISMLFLTPTFALEMITSVPFIVTIFVPNSRNLFVPVFLNCWLAKFAFQHMLNDLNRAMQRSQTALSQHILILCSTLICLIFTSACGIQHLQRAGRQQMDLFQSFYFVIVTFSTVGYGEFYPDHYLSQLFVVIMICVAFLVIPSQLEQLAYTWMEKQKSGGEYSQHRARSEKHVVLCIAQLNADMLMDFLNEFYAHPRLQDFYVILLTPSEIDVKMRLLLQVPLWTERVIFIKGSVMKDTDLERARMAEAEAAFILAGRNYTEKATADQQTILRSWAVKDFAPKTPQYVQIFRPENKMHVKHANYVVCEDEFKYALLANNCICPGISTFITLVLHTSRGEEGQHSSEPWHKTYGKHSGNEIYHVKLGQSKFFGEYEGKSFTYASFHAHRKYGVALVAIQKDRPGSTIQLNPGAKHTMKVSDICYYMSITKEELSSFVHIPDSPKRTGSKVATTIAGIGSLALEMQHTRASPASQVLSDHPEVAKKFKKRHGTLKMKEIVEEDSAMLAVHSVERKPSIAPVPDTFDAAAYSADNDSRPGSPTTNTDGMCARCGLVCVETQYAKGFPPVSPYIGTSATLCFLLNEKKPLCCLELAKPCDHCSFRTANDYDWNSPAVILVADHASNGLYNFIIPLRAHYQPAHQLYPIVLLLEERPDPAFLSTLSCFPMIYWMLGSIECLDDMLRAGIVLAEHVVVVNKEDNTLSDKTGRQEDYMADCNTIVSVQTMHRLFPSVRLITELSLASNMRFMQFNAKDLYALHQSKVEKKERSRGSHIAYMFRLPFASGNVFSANMLDTLLYQAFVKDYLIQFVRLLLGIDQAVGSGYLSSIELTEEDMWIRTYGRLYQKLCSSDAYIPIGIYRTQRMDSNVISNQVSLELEKQMRGSTDSDKADDIWKRTFSCKYLVSERHEISNMVRCRMDNLNLPSEDYTYSSDKRGTISYVILNPSFDLKLEAGDIVYVIKPSLPLLKGSKSSTPARISSRKRKQQDSCIEARLNHVADRIADEETSLVNEQEVPLLTLTTPKSSISFAPNEQPTFNGDAITEN